MNTTTITMPVQDAVAKRDEYRRRLHAGAHKDAVEKWRLCEQLYSALADGEALVNLGRTPGLKSQSIPNYFTDIERAVMRLTAPRG